MANSLCGVVGSAVSLLELVTDFSAFHWNEAQLQSP